MQQLNAVLSCLDWRSTCQLVALQARTSHASRYKRGRTEKGPKLEVHPIQRPAHFFNVPLDAFTSEDPDAPLITITVDRRNNVVPRFPVSRDGSADMDAIPIRERGISTDDTDDTDDPFSILPDRH